MLQINSMKLPNGKTLNFALSDNEKIVIKGANGSGKSLLLKSIARLTLCTFKTFTFEAQDVKTISPESYRSQVLYLSPFPIFHADMTVEDFFQVPLKFIIYQDHKVQFDYQSWPEKWGIPPESVRKLSTGQRQLISLLRALTLRSRILLLDGPTGNLDTDKMRDIDFLFHQYQGAIVVVSHSEEFSF